MTVVAEEKRGRGRPLKEIRVEVHVDWMQIAMAREQALGEAEQKMRHFADRLAKKTHALGVASRAVEQFDAALANVGRWKDGDRELAKLRAYLQQAKVDIDQAARL